MTSSEYREAIQRLALTQNAAARFFGVHEVTGRRWASEGPPAPVSKMLKLMLALQFSPSYVNKVLGEDE